MPRGWDPIIARARDLVNAFTTRFGRAPTLRRLHYELVSDQFARVYGYVNTQADYKRLSELTAVGRRAGVFPDLDETVRWWSREQGFANADALREHIREICKVDRMRGQAVTIAVVVEKAGSRGFLHDWFDAYSVYITALAGFTSQTIVDNLKRFQRAHRKPMIVLYAGDHDASGEDIDRDFQDRCGVEGIEVRRVALLPGHVQQYNLPVSPFDKVDSRAQAFINRHGGLWQVELDALDPDDLRTLFEAEFNKLWDFDAYQAQLDREPELLKEVLGDDA